MSSSRSQTVSNCRKTAYFSGRVQGVGFRYTVQNIALQYDVAGFVRNLPDGRVEVVAEGPNNELDGLLDSVKSRMNTFIRHVDILPSPGTGEFHSFSIRH